MKDYTRCNNTKKITSVKTSHLRTLSDIDIKKLNIRCVKSYTSPAADHNLYHPLLQKNQCILIRQPHSSCQPALQLQPKVDCHTKTKFVVTQNYQSCPLDTTPPSHHYTPSTKYTLSTTIHKYHQFLYTYLWIRLLRRLHTYITTRMD